MEIEATLTKPIRILVIVAHPDDIEFGIAGSVIRWTDAGADVTYCMITDGAAGSNDKDGGLQTTGAAAGKNRTRQRRLRSEGRVTGICGWHAGADAGSCAAT